MKRDLDEDLRNIKEYDSFKRFIKNEVIKAIDEEDCEKMKFMTTTLDLLIQMKKKLDLFTQVTKVGQEPRESTVKEEKEISSSIQTQMEEVPQKKTIKKQKAKEVKVKKEATIKKVEQAEEKEKEKEKEDSPSSKKLPSEGKLTKGLKTPEKAFILPVIESIMEFGGTAPRMQVIERVYEKMKHILNEYDLSPMPYNKYIPRWKDTLHWVRIGLVERGIIAKGTEKGIWTLTDYGKAYYAQHIDNLDKNVDVQNFPTQQEVTELAEQNTSGDLSN